MTEDLHRAATQLLAARTKQEVYRTAVRAVAHLTSADRCEVLEANGSGLQSRTTVTFGRAEEGGRVGPLDTHESILERVQETGMAGLIDDLTAVPAGDAETVYRSLLCVPIDGHGLLVAADREPGFFSGETFTRMGHLADLVGAALDRFGGGGEDGSRLEAVAEVISHDVQNAIAVANGRLDLADATADGDQLEAVEAAHDRLLDMTDDLVTLLRTGDSVHSIEPVDVEDAARRAWTTVETAEAEVALVDPPRVMADHSSLCQLLENLFRNAVEHGGEAVTVEVSGLEDGHGFYVADDGPGVPPGEQARVFDLGYTTADGSTGYGLSIVDRIARAHGWDVTVGASAAGGARFEVRGVDPAPADEQRGDRATAGKRP